MKVRIHRLNQIASLSMVAALLLSGCALIPIGKQARLRDPAPGPELRPDAPPEYDILVAHDHQARGDLDDALAAFERALEKDPDSAYIHRKLAMSLIRAGRPAESLEHAERALEIDPEDPRTRVFVGQLYRMQRNVAAAELALLDEESGEPINREAGVLLYQVYMESDRSDQAIDLALWLVDVVDDPIYAYAALAKAYELAEEGAERAIYGEILELHPHHHETLMKLADVQLGENDTEGALQTLKEIEANYPNDMRSVVRLGFLYYETEHFSESASRFETFLASEPGDDEVRFFLGIVRRRMGEDAAAIEVFSAIPEDSEHSAEAHTQLAVLLERRGDFARALEEVEAAVAAKPTRPRELYYATLRAKAGDFDGAVAYLEGLLLKDPDDDELLFNLGVVFSEAKRTQEALEYMERAIEQNPNNASALNYVGYTWAERGDNLDQAEDYIVRALDLRPDDGFIIDSLGWVYYMRARPLFDTGRNEEAKKYLDRALKELLRAQELTGGDPVVSEHLGDTYLLLDQKDRALKNYREAVDLTPREGEQPDLLEKLEALQREIE
ncbi:MAG: tetratricopeptide repeat protein [Deltaproteobacteria bacterium]|nr:tetratricopeptide repeat protein [Deltaproteobacteria bacterium]